MRTHQLGKPVEHCKPGTFPQPIKGTPDAAVRLLQIIGRLKTITDEHGVRAVARQADISNSTLSRTITGEIWPSSITIASVEDAYETQIWENG